jgi:hypothetical protein
MNVYQKVTFGVASLLVFAYGIVWGFGLDMLAMVALAAIIAALLSLAPVRWLIYSFNQMIGAIFGFAAHTLGNIGDWVADRSFAAKQQLAGKQTKRTSTVPGWDSPNLVRANASSSSSDLDVPRFMSEPLPH